MGMFCFLGQIHSSQAGTVLCQQICVVLQQQTTSFQLPTLSRNVQSC
ncbi:hypothetical protein X975_09580, partial [Stegodyphus mimosarum]